MLLKDVWALFDSEVFSRKSTGRLFNMYRDRHPKLDAPDGPAIRRDNLRRSLATYETMPNLFLLVEAPGPWGCRFSGVPITSEAQLLDPEFPIHGRRSSTSDDPHTEYSASIYWRVMAPYYPAFLTWNTVPFHPHDEGKPLSIRTPTAGEIDAFEHVIDGMLSIVMPVRVAAVGRKAQRALRRLHVEHTYIRHPSQGGAGTFEKQVLAVLAETGIG